MSLVLPWHDNLEVDCLMERYDDISFRERVLIYFFQMTSESGHAWRTENTGSMGDNSIVLGRRTSQDYDCASSTQIA